MAARHGGFAALWRDRLPVRAGVDPAALVHPAGQGFATGFGYLGEADDLVLAASGLLDVVVPMLSATYAEHLDEASPVAEAPVIDVLRQIRWSVERELASGAALLEGIDNASNGADAPGREVVAFCAELKRLFETP